MATPRKHWFRVADSMGREAISNDELATIVRLMCELNTRWARDGLNSEEACRATFRPGDLMALTGSASLVRARRILQGLAAHFSLTVNASGAYTSIEWPKWAIFQELPAPTEGNSKATSRLRNAPSAPSPSPSPATSPSEGRQKGPAASPAPRSCVCPDELSPHDQGRLMDWSSPKGFTIDQCDYAWARVRDWSRSKSVKRTDWLATLRNAMTDGWALKGYGQNPTGERESAAQAKVRRTKENAAAAYEMVMARKQQLGLTEIEGGQS